MKKKVVVTLLSAMLCMSLVPAPVMAFEDQAQSVEVTEENRENETETEAESASVSEEQTGDASGEISLEALTESMTLNGTEFDTSKTYIVPLTLKNANNLEQDSAAVACPGKFGTLTFDEDGTPRLSTNLRSVTVGTLTDYAYNFKIYQENKHGGDLADADIVSTQNVAKADGSGEHEVPETISFTIPKACYEADGIYLSMYVDAMGYAPDAYLQIDYANAKESGDSTLNYTTEVSTAEVEQFGNYNVTSQVTVTDGRITDVVLDGNDFKGNYAEDNQMYLNKAINGSKTLKGMKQKLIGLYMNDAQKLNDLDTVSGATYSSNAIKTATMNALGVKIEQEVIPEAPTEALEAGLYSIDIKDRTAVVDHGLIGESKKATAYLRVDDTGKMWLTYKMISGTKGEPLYVLGYNGYYKNNDSSALTTEGVTYSTQKMTAPTIGDCTVVTDITVPLDSLRQTYTNNVYLYVDAMKALEGEVSGVMFDRGKFNIDSTVTLYWDTLTNLSEENDNPLAKLSDGVYKISGEMFKVNKVAKSMSNEAINHNIKLTVKNGVPYISMNFNGMNVSGLKGYLKNLNYYCTGFGTDKYGNPTGEMLPVTIDSYQKYSDGTRFSDSFGKDYPNDVTFPLVSEAMQEGDDCNYIPMQVYVPVMESLSKGSGTQNVYLKLDYSTLKKTTANDKDFAEQEKAPVKPVIAKAQSITGGSTSYTRMLGSKNFNLGQKAKTTLSYKSSNTKVVTVDSKGNVRLRGVGTAKITVTAKATSAYKQATRTITIRVTGNKTPTFKVKTVSKTLSVKTLKKSSKTYAIGASVNSKGTLSYKKRSGNSKITINSKTGKVTVKKGTARGTYKVRIRVSAATRGIYKAAYKDVVLTIRVK